MTAPKHLWAGDWERESEAVRRGEHAPEQPMAAEEPAAVPRHRRSVTFWAGVGAAIVVVCGAAFGLSALVGSGARRPASPPKVATVPTPFGPGAPPPQQAIPRPVVPPVSSRVTPPVAQTQPAYGPVVYWLGMQIQAISPGVVVIDTVQLGSEADRAGLEPGEQLVAVGGRSLDSAADIVAAVRGLGAGHQITIQVSYGSSSPQTVALTLGAAPSRHP